MNRRAFGLAAFVASFLSTMALAAAPTVIKAIPDNGATDVNPAITELRITFDQPMDQGGFSFVGGGPNFPGSGRAHWIDDRTCVMPITLKPSHQYALSINSVTFQNFRSKQGEPATPYPIVFSTAAPANVPPLTPKANDAALATLRDDLQNDYAYLDVHKVDWDQAFADAQPAIESAKTAPQFATAVGKVLAKANDLHIWLKVGDITVPSAIRRVDPNCRISSLARLVPNFSARNRQVITGQFDGGIAYVMIGGFAGDASTLTPALDALSGANAVIVDVRTNSGGDEDLAQQFAGCFITLPQPYAQDIIRQGGKDSPVLQRVLQPNAQHPTFSGKVALLIGPENMSSCESFIMMMKTSPNCTTIGAKTFGSSGNPKPHDLGNGVTVMLPSWRDLRLDGTLLEGTGITPDIPVDWGADPAADPVLDRALALLRNGN
jgi:hypothetical protein